jgi:hypothetical protein
MYDGYLTTLICRYKVVVFREPKTIVGGLERKLSWSILSYSGLILLKLTKTTKPVTRVVGVPVGDRTEHSVPLEPAFSVKVIDSRSSNGKNVNNASFSSTLICLFVCLSISYDAENILFPHVLVILVSVCRVLTGVRYLRTFRATDKETLQQK